MQNTCRIVWGGHVDDKIFLGGIPRDVVWYTWVHGTWWDVPTSTEGAAWCHCKATLSYLWKVVVTGQGSCRLKESICHPHLQDGQERGSRELEPIGLTLIVGNVMEKIILEIITKHFKTVLGRSQHGFTKRKSCLTNLIDSFLQCLSQWMDMVPDNQL